MTAQEALVAVIDWLNASAVPYMIVGSLSSSFHGIARSSKDADVVIHLEGQALGTLAAALPGGLYLDPQMSFESVSGTWRNIVSVSESDYTIELFRLSEDSHDQERFRRRQRIELHGHATYVPSAEDVVITKLRWFSSLRRQKDWDDVHDVLTVQGSRVDWDYINQWCGQHGTRDLLDSMRKALPTI